MTAQITWDPERGDQFVEALRQLISTKYGGDIQAALGSIVTGSRPQAAVVEVIERRHGKPTGSLSDEVTVPTEVWLNGVQLLMPRDCPITIHDISVPGSGADMVQVTMTLIAKRVVVDQVWRGEDAAERLRRLGLLGPEKSEVRP